MGYSFAEIQSLHKKYAPSDGAYQMVFSHCVIVCDITKQLIKSSTVPIDTDTAVTGALVHDIGVYSYFDVNGNLMLGKDSVAHGLGSAAILTDEGFPERICSIGLHHTGVYLSQKDVLSQNLPMPLDNYSPTTNEELIVMYADKFHTKGKVPIFNSFEWYRNDVVKFGKDKAAKFEHLAAIFGNPNLEVLSQKYNIEIR